MSGYTLLDFGDGARLEQWNSYTLIRPDPTAVEALNYPEKWKSVDAEYVGEKGKGAWENTGNIPEQWITSFGDIELITKLTPYKHTGVFPEQYQNWEWMRSLTKGKTLTVLNLFAYTGGATIALAKDGHKVTHVDSAKPAVNWANENAALNHIPGDRIRWILEDAKLFAERELKRGNTYNGIILDPPAYGHSPTGKAWRSERDLKPLLETCVQLLSGDTGFIVLNSYASHDSPESFIPLLAGIFHKHSTKKVDIEATELLLTAEDGRTLSTGTVVRCAIKKAE